MELSWRQRVQLWLRLGLRLVGCLLILWAAVRLGPVLVFLFAPFLLALLVAWALSPFVRWIHERLGLSRQLSALGLLGLVLVCLGGLAWWLLSAGVGEILSLAGNWESLVASFQALVDGLGGRFSRWMSLLPASVQTAVDNMVSQLFLWLETAIPLFLSSAVERAADLARGLPSFAVASVVFLMAAYFFIADFPRLQSAARTLPPGPRRLLSQVKKAASAGVGGYNKAQVILSIGVFFILLFGFLLIRQPYFLLLAVALAVLDFIPILGSGTVMVPWAAADLLMGNYRHAVGLMAVWGMVALFRRIGEPKALGDKTGLSPLLSLASIYVGMKLAGVPGMILGPVLCLVLLDLLSSGLLEPALALLRLASADLFALFQNGDQKR